MGQCNSKVYKIRLQTRLYPGLAKKKTGLKRIFEAGLEGILVGKTPF